MFRISFQIFWRSTDIEILPANWRSEVYLFLIALVMAFLLAFSPIITALSTLFLMPFVFIVAYAGYSGLSGFKETIRYTFRNFGTVVSNFYLILIMAVPTMLLVDTLFGQMLFSFMDWIVYADTMAIDNMNVVLQCVTYLFMFTLMFCVFSVCFALNAYKLREINQADALLEEISSVGTRRRLRGMEME